MSGEPSGTSGAIPGTSGVIPLRLYLFCVGLCAAVTVVNVSSILIEDPPGERNFALWEPFTWEISSALAFAVLLPGLYRVYRRFHWSRLPLSRFLLAQAGAWLAYVLGHAAIMVALRHLVYGLMGGAYDFSRGNLLLQLIYEGRKDALTCALMAAIFWVHDRTRQAVLPLELPARIEIRSDGRTLYLTPGEISHVEAAGNYVEVYTAAKPLLVRGTLAEYEKILAPYGFVRIHRSRLLNPAQMSGHEPTPSGDIRVTLADGRELIASRRYRAGLDGQHIKKRQAPG